MTDHSETALAEHVIEYFRSFEWDVYQEVYFQGSVGDLVITKANLIGVVECKQALGMPLLEQCYRWLPYANFVWAGIWDRAQRRDEFARRIAKDYGIGVVGVHWYSPELNRREEVAPQFRRTLAKSPILRDVLCEEQKHAAKAGGNHGGHWTPFRNTCSELVSIVRKEPGIELRAAIAKIRHHYSSPASARSSLLHWLELGSVKGVKLERDGKKLTLKLAEGT